MATKTNQNLTEALKEHNYIKPGTPEHERLLAAGYGMSLEEAKIIVAEWEKDHKSWPLDEYRKAKAMLANYGSAPKVVDPEPGWHRDRTEG